jgi:mannosyl-oligosaccharide alpha-1,2-mannosidase
MYLKAMEAVRKTMVYRPMLPDNRDVRFTGKVTIMGSQNEPRFEAEVTHLTCFVGGMFGMGSKIFDVKGDLEIAEKLSDGCVWAYESTASGVMPEAAEVLPCESMTNCPWNQTLWEESLDPTGQQRDNNVKLYDANKAELQAKAEQERIAALSKLEAEENEKILAPEIEQPHDPIIGLDSIGEVNDVDVDSKPPPSTRFDAESMNSTIADQTPRKESSIQKRQIEKEGPNIARDTSSPLNSTDKSVAQYQTKLEDTKIELNSAAAGRDVKTPSSRVPQSQAPTPGEIPTDPMRPMSHKEYVEHKIEEGIPPGFLRIRDNRYILRYGSNVVPH